MNFSLSRLLWLCLCFWLAFTNGLLANWSSREGVVTTTTTYHYNAANQCTSTTGAQTLSYTYNANGNRVTRTEGLLTDTYSYDQENRLIELDKYTGAATGTYAFAYDYRTRRIQSTHGTASTKFIFSGSTSVQEIENGLHSAEYIRGPDLGGGVGGLLYSLRSGGASYTHSNTRGDIIAKSNSTGTLTYEAQYEGYGQVTSESGSTPDRQRSNSKDQDIPGYANEGFRYRDLDSGTFLTKDPAGFVDGPNLYAYVRQNPWTKFDPEGLAETPNYYESESRSGGRRLEADPDDKSGRRPLVKNGMVLAHDYKYSSVIFGQWGKRGSAWEPAIDYGIGAPTPVISAKSIFKENDKAQDYLSAFGEAARMEGVQGTMAIANASAWLSTEVITAGLMSVATFAAKRVALTVEQYTLRAVDSGFYPVMTRGSKVPTGITWLEKGDVWKFGTTKNPATRYSDSFLRNTGDHGLRYSTEWQGTATEALQLERMKIQNFQLQSGGTLPAGNKIVR